MESDSRDIFPSSAIAPSTAMKSDSRDTFSFLATVSSPAINSYKTQSLFVHESSLDYLSSQAEELHIPHTFRDHFSIRADWPNFDNETYSGAN